MSLFSYFQKRYWWGNWYVLYRQELEIICIQKRALHIGYTSKRSAFSTAQVAKVRCTCAKHIANDMPPFPHIGLTECSRSGSTG